MKTNKMADAAAGNDVPDCPVVSPAMSREARRAQRAAEKAENDAGKKLIAEAKAARVKAAKAKALRDADRAMERIQSRAASTSRLWSRQRKDEQKRERKKLAELRERHSVARDEPEVLRDERDWLASNDRPKIIVEAEPEAVLGMVGFVSDLRRHDPPMLEVPPPKWNEGWAAKRVIDAYRTLSLLPGSTRPAGFGRAWPAYVTEFSDAVAQARTDAAKTRVIEVATIEDIERMDRVFTWPARFLRDRPEESRALFQWANAKVIRGDMRELAKSFQMSEATFRRFRRYATSLLTVRLKEGLEQIF
jgi:hypothetical protein